MSSELLPFRDHKKKKEDRGGGAGGGGGRNRSSSQYSVLSPNLAALGGNQMYILPHPGPRVTASQMHLYEIEKGYCTFQINDSLVSLAHHSFPVPNCLLDTHMCTHMVTPISAHLGARNQR